MDGVALASVITSGVLGVATASIAVWTARQTATLGREQRIQQRCADGYLQVLQLAEREAQWLDACVHNFGLDDDLEQYGIDARIVVPQPTASDRATASAILAAFGSARVRASHAAWRTTADSFSKLVNEIVMGFQLNGPPYSIPDKEMKTLTEDLQPPERAARQALAEAVATELGHR
jgi:hypothetical protein